MFDLGLTLKSLSSRVAWQTRLIEAIGANRRQLLSKETLLLVQNTAVRNARDSGYSFLTKPLINGRKMADQHYWLCYTESGLEAGPGAPRPTVIGHALRPLFLTALGGLD
jgi:hypothetical protein